MPHGPTKQRPELVYEDEQILVAIKPPGLHSVPDRYDPAQPSLSVILGRDRPEVFVVHRLDKDTSGLVVMALTPAAHRSLSMQFTNREVKKAYLALVKGAPEWDEKTLEFPLRVDADRRHRTRVDRQDGKPSVTRVRVLERFDSYSLVEAMPETGRTHQIRVHLVTAGHPVVADPLYGDGKPLMLSSFKHKYKPGRREERPLVARTALHAVTLEFRHPTTDNVANFAAPVFRDMKAATQQLRKFGSGNAVSPSNLNHDYLPR